MYKLLTPEERKKVEGEYRIRLATVMAALVSGLTLFGILALIPSLILARSQDDTAQLNLSIAEQSSKIDSNALKTWAMTMKQKITYLSLDKNQDLPYNWYLALLAQKPSGITVNNLTYQKQNSKIFIRVRGVAKDRQTLLNFQDNLNKSGKFANFSFPVDTLAKDTDISFDYSLNPPTP